jgi:hypothetical protein
MELNTLSWIIYFAEILGGLSFLFSFIFIMLCIGIAVGTIIWLMKTFGYDSEDEDNLIRSARAARITKKMILAAVIVVSVDILIPNSRTVYLIAASEIGEQVLNTETAVKLKKIIDHKLDEIIAEQEGK